MRPCIYLNISTMPLFSTHQRAILLMIIAPTLWSIAGVFTRHLEAARDFEITLWRSLFAGLFVAAVLVRQNGWTGTVRVVRAGGALGILSGMMWCTMFVCFMIALTKTTVANTLIMLSVSPLLTALLAWIFLRQKIPQRTWMAIAAAFVGICGMFAQGLGGADGAHVQGMLIAGAVPVAAAINLIAIKRAGHGVDLIPSVLLGSIFSVLLMLPFALPLQASFHDIALLATLGVFQLGLPCMLMVQAAKSLTAPEVSLLALLEVLLGPLWTWLGAGEVPTRATLIGGAVVLAALVFNELAGLRKSAVPSAPV